MTSVFQTPPQFEALAAHHDRAGFDCGEASFNVFLQHRARQNAERNLGVTHAPCKDTTKELRPRLAPIALARC